MHPSGYSTAWDHPPTRRAWANQLTMNTIAFICWFLTPWALLAVLVVILSPAFVPIFVIPFGYSLYRTLIAFAFFMVYVRMRRILQNYPWRLDRAPYSLSQHPESPHKEQWIEFPNPERPGEQIPLHFLKHFRGYWWQRRMAPRAKPELKAQLEPIWFAGDPRFFGVIAVSSSPPSKTADLKPRRLHVLTQPNAIYAPGDHNSWQATANDVGRAQRAGARSGRRRD